MKKTTIKDNIKTVRCIALPFILVEKTKKQVMCTSDEERTNTYIFHFSDEHKITMTNTIKATVFLFNEVLIKIHKKH